MSLLTSLVCCFSLVTLNSVNFWNYKQLPWQTTVLHSPVPEAPLFQKALFLSFSLDYVFLDPLPTSILTALVFPALLCPILQSQLSSMFGLLLWQLAHVSLSGFSNASSVLIGHWMQCRQAPRIQRHVGPSPVTERSQPYDSCVFCD